MGVEFELKYRATPELLAKLRKDICAEEQIFQMHTTYYDTPTGQFSARLFTLRCRQENDLHVCTLKIPSAGIGRGEWEVECDRIETAIDMLCKLGAPEEIRSLASEGLLPICGARFTRIAKSLVWNGCILELALDEGVLIGAGRQIPLCEIEIELKEGDPASCIAYGKTLAQIYHLENEEKSKFRRALALYKGEA